MVSYDKLPEILFKYRSWSEPYDSGRFQRKLLTHNQIYLSSANQFNDPFDFSLPINFDIKEYTRENIVKKTFLAMKREFPDQPNEVILKEAKGRYDSGIFNDNYWKQIAEIEKQEAYKIGIFCLSKKKNDLLMWAHYADWHKGYCVGIQKSELSKHFINDALLQPIYYKTKFPLYKFINPDPDQHIQRLFTKSRHWAYEKEYRFIKADSAGTTIELNNEAIKEIILGLKMSEADMNEILKLKNNKYPNAKIYKCELSKSEFKVDIKPL